VAVELTDPNPRPPKLWVEPDTPPELPLSYKRPLATTHDTFRKSLILASGLPSTRIRSARLPTSISAGIVVQPHDTLVSRNREGGSLGEVD